jgi:5-methylthioadenosine/S-adenosylhomocysteine deaminase
MPDLLIIENGFVLTLNDRDDAYACGSVVIQGSRILDIGPTEALRTKYPSENAPENVHVIDATGKCVMPGLIDLHYHTAIAKGWNDHLPLLEWLETCWYPLVKGMTAPEAYCAGLLSYAESIKCGVTTINDMYRNVEALADAAEAIGIRAVLSNELADDEYGLDTLQTAREAFAAKNNAARGRIGVRIGVEWLPISSHALLRGARKLADELGTGMHIHLSESLNEVETSIKKLGRRPIEVAYDHGILGPDCIAAHCVWTTDAEIALLRETGTHVSHNPSSNAKLGNGIMRLPEMLAQGINVGLGHDAAECNNSLDMFQVMKFTALIHRANRVDPSLLQAPDLLKLATRNGARALGHETGELSPGKCADIILIDLNSEMFTPLNPHDKKHLMSHLVYAANGSCVDTTIIDGEIVMQGRKLTKVNERDVLQDANRAFQRLVNAVPAPER